MKTVYKLKPFQIFWYNLSKQKKCLYCNTKFNEGIIVKRPMQFFEITLNAHDWFTADYLVHAQTSHGYSPEILTMFIEKTVIKDLTIMKTEELVKQYTVIGIPADSIPALLKEVNRTEEEFNEFMFGQTCALVGGVVMYYPWDVQRFIDRLPVID